MKFFHFNRSVTFLLSCFIFILIPPVFSAESFATRISLSCLIKNTWQICTIGPDGNGFTVLTHSGSDKTPLSWSVEKKQVFFTTNSGQLGIIDPMSKVKKMLDIGMHGMTDAVISSDGSKVLFSLSIANSIDANDIWLVEIEGLKRRRLTNMKHMQHDPALSHDEKRVVFVSGAGGQNHDLFVLDMKSGGTRQLTVGQRYHFEPACSINDEIAFSSNRTDDYEIWVSDFEGKRFEQITHSPGMDGQPTWSPDGKKIAFVSSRSGYPAIWVINRDGSNVHQISPDGMRCRGPVWSR